jgi:hypothetical protein
MGSKVVAAALAATSMAAFPGVAAANRLDYSKNSVSGEYNAYTVVRPSHLDYSKNSLTGQYAASPSQPPSGHADAASVRPIVVRVVGSRSSFDWGDALAGAGVPVLLVVAFGGVRHVRRRRVGFPARTESMLVSG